MLIFFPLHQGELEHRRVKRFYARTNKVQFVLQITKHQRREELLRRIRKRLDDLARKRRAPPVPQASNGASQDSVVSSAPTIGGQAHLVPANPTAVPSLSTASVPPVVHTSTLPTLGFDDEDPLPLTPPHAHHHISTTQKYPLRLQEWLMDHADDPATRVRSHAFRHCVKSTHSAHFC